MPIRVYVAWNEQREDGRLWLHLAKSMEDLTSSARPLREGLPLVLYWDPEDPTTVYEMDGILEYGHETETWLAHPTRGSARSIFKRESEDRSQNLE